MSARYPSRARRRVLTAAVLTVTVGAPMVAHADGGRVEPRLVGRAVLPAEAVSDGPPSGQFIADNDVNDGVRDGIVNGIQFPRPAQPVEGFSGIVDGRRHGEYLAMADNGFGNKANSYDFNIRAYYLTPDFKTAAGGSGAVTVGDYIQFSDPLRQLPFPIRNEATAARVLTGADIDPESIQRARDGSFWVGDEFGPWLLHFDPAGRLLEPPIELPDGLVAATNPAIGTRPVTINNSRGIEAMAMTSNGRTLYVVLEGAVAGSNPDPAASRRVYEFDVRSRSFTAQLDPYRVDVDGHFVADAQALDRNRLLIIERDGAAAAVRKVYEVDLRKVGDDGYLVKTQVVDLGAIPDPNGVSLPPINTGDVGLGDPFRVACESIEALHILTANRLLLGCDNNLPNKGRNPNRADDNELIVVRTGR